LNKYPFILHLTKKNNYNYRYSSNLLQTYSSQSMLK
jgi:hypothetical protein